METQALPDWLQPFTGGDLKAVMTHAAILASVDDEGWPHQAYLSVGEILARPDGISVALWPGSRTTANITRAGQAVLYVASGGCIWEARLTLRRRQAEDSGPAIFDGEMVETRRHAAPYSEVNRLVDFRLSDVAGTLDRWAAQIKRLRDV